ncbi:hypothetical protein C7M61_002534 [Candidozyma pseudohaemuli]|uniref:Protein KRE1 n=1 Tax=Candidozyma pseudohaemuli TaxID=418784 RepID=A0A2P7YRM4_9ASCO|nr:hypothetical protein C7M61_002534 [[Candida] pseudohaemulonii]PSK38599.1 hypothetical protein C7M61_002534 [[Candida] pseudohaemulonii]
MNFLYFLSLLSLALAFDFPDFLKRADTETTTSNTIVYVTLTTGGKVITTSTAYKQSFMTTYSDTTSSVAAGSVGVGLQTGEVGNVRSYEQTTISNNGQAGAYAGFVGWAAIALGFLL